MITSLINMVRQINIITSKYKISFRLNIIRQKIIVILLFFFLGSVAQNWMDPINISNMDGIDDDPDFTIDNNEVDTLCMAT